MPDQTQARIARNRAARPVPKRAARPGIEALDRRDLLATLAPIAPVSAPASLGFQLALDGGAAGDQTYTVTSDNPAIGATVARGQFLTIGVTHASSGANDPAFAGNLVFQLFEDLTPVTASRIEQLVNQGFYTSPTTTSPILPSKNFHRIAANFPGPNDFIVQGGSQSGTGSGSLVAPGFPFADEFNRQLAFTGAGQLAMANSGDDTNDSQFFITTGSPRFLDFQHTIFGQLVSGAETLQRMTQVAKGTDGTTPISPVLFSSTSLSTSNPDGVVHLDLTGAFPGQTSNVTVTARDAAGATVARTFTVTAAANNDASGQPIIERPFLAPVQNQVVGRRQTAVFQLPGVATTPGDPLTYGVGGGPGTGTTAFTPIPATSGTASVDSFGVVRVVPAANFTGVINLLVGVRDNVNRAGTANVENIANYDTQRITLTVTNGEVVNLPPIALNGFTAVAGRTPTTVQLLGDTANPGTSQTLQFTILTGPTNGRISNFDASTGTFTYTPNGDFQGNDTLTFQVTDVGAPTPNLTSNPAVQTLVVGGANTGAVRLIDRVLVVTPLPKATLQDRSANTIVVSQTGSIVQVRVNGLVDNIQPAAADIDRIVVFGSKNTDYITVTQDVKTPTTLDGGHGGNNVVLAGAAQSTMFGWFGRKNVLRGGPSNDRLTGRAGRVRFVRSGGNDLLFAGVPNPGFRQKSPIFPGKQFDAKPNTPRGTFYRFIGNELVAIKKV